MRLPCMLRPALVVMHVCLGVTYSPDNKVICAIVIYIVKKRIISVGTPLSRTGDNVWPATSVQNVPCTITRAPYDQFAIAVIVCITAEGKVSGEPPGHDFISHCGPCRAAIVNVPVTLLRAINC